MQRVTAEDICNQRAFADIEPWDETRADFRTAQVCATLAQLRGCEKTAKDFMPDYAKDWSAETEKKRQAVPGKIKMWLQSMGVKS